MQSSRILMNKGEDGIVVGLFFCMLARIFLQSNILFFVMSKGFVTRCGLLHALDLVDLYRLYLIYQSREAERQVGR